LEYERFDRREEVPQRFHRGGVRIAPAAETEESRVDAGEDERGERLDRQLDLRIATFLDVQRAVDAAQCPDALVPRGLLVGHLDRDLARADRNARSEEHTSELQSRENLVCRLLREKKK